MEYSHLLRVLAISWETLGDEYNSVSACVYLQEIWDCLPVFPPTKETAICCEYNTHRQYLKKMGKCTPKNMLEMICFVTLLPHLFLLMFILKLDFLKTFFFLRQCIYLCATIFYSLNFLLKIHMVGKRD